MNEFTANSHLSMSALAFEEEKARWVKVLGEPSKKVEIKKLTPIQRLVKVFK